MEVYSWENHGTKMGDFPVSHLYNIGGIQGVSIHIYPYLVTRNDAEEGGSSAKTAASFWFGNSTFWLPSPNINLTWNQQMAEHHVRSPINWGFRVQKIGGSGWCRHVAWICWATAGRRNWCVPIGKRCVLGRAIAACWEHQFWESRNPDPIISGIRMPNIFFQQKAMARASDVNFKQLLLGWDWTPRKVSTCWYWVGPGPDGSRRSDAEFAFRACGWCLTGFMDVVSLWPTWPGKPGKDKWPIFHAYKYIIYIYIYVSLYFYLYIYKYLFIYICISIYI